MIHLELLARHKGSVLGNYPGEVRPMLLLRSWSWLIFYQVQPSQKLFESQLFHLLQFEMDPSKIIWLEYESFKIGNITVPKVKHVMMTLMPGMICLFAESFQQDGWVGPSPHWGNPRWSGVLYPAGKPSAILRRLEEEKTSKLNQEPTTHFYQDYSYICADPEALKATLRRLDRLAGKKMVTTYFQHLLHNISSLIS